MAFPSQIATLLLCLLSAFTFNSACNEKDQQTLLNFKEGVIDPSGILSTWSTEEDCCQWTGVLCDKITGRVTELDLHCYKEPFSYRDKSQCLGGEFDLSLLKLEFLNYLDLSDNNFRVMHMPSNMQYDSKDSWTCHNLSTVTSLQWCGNSSNLHYLDLSHNYDLHLDNLHWLSHFPSLKYLSLNGIDLHRETQWLQLVSELPMLLELHLRRCELNDINPSLDYVNFTSLQGLYLSHNSFYSKLPDWLFNLSDISQIKLGYNFLQGQIPKTLLNLRNLQYLSLHENRLDGSIPDWLGQHEHLQGLNLDSNSFSGPIPSTLGNLSSLIDLNLRNNPLTGSLPKSLGQLSNLKSLRVGDNSLLGILSEKNFVNLTNLEILDLGLSAFVIDFDPHWIPPFQLLVLDIGYLDLKHHEWLYTQRSLRQLSISNSRISLNSWQKFWNFVAEIEFLILFNNSIIEDMSNVVLNSRIIIIESNIMRGGLPRLLPNVTFLSLSDNSLSGSLDTLLCHKMNGESKLLVMDISYNLLSGELTDCWKNWKHLVQVDLGENNLTGKIPPSMGLLSNLTTLHLYNNDFFGDIPLSLQNCQNLRIVNLLGNRFSGEIPHWIAQTTRALQLRSNQFSGNIPSQICHLSSLVILDFAENRISGPLPSCLDNITSMVFNNASIDDITFQFKFLGKYYEFTDSLMLLTKGQESQYVDNLKLMRIIDLSNNDLSGTIIPDIFNLTTLQSLNLSHNQLMGKIPKEIGNMKQLESLDLSGNQLSGEIPQSMSDLSFLEFLNLSFNNLNGKIPSGTQLQSFDALSYIGNPELCGTPLTKNCPWEEKSSHTSPISEHLDEDKSDMLKWFYIGMAVGFVTSFWGVCASIFFIRTWRHAYFNFLYNLNDRCYVMVLNFFR